MPIIKKTVAIHPVVDRYIRLTWSRLIQDGNDATYSTAMNWMLLAIIWEMAIGKRELAKKTRETLDKFLTDPTAAAELNAEDYMEALKRFSPPEGPAKSLRK